MPEERFENAGVFIHRVIWMDGREETFQPTTPSWVLEGMLNFYVFLDGGADLLMKRIPLAGVRHWESREKLRLLPLEVPD